MDTVQIATLAESIMRQVGARIRDEVREPNRFQVMEKTGRELVTEIDIWSEGIIQEAVSKHFPDHTVVGEETSAQLVKDLGKDLPSIVSQGVSWIVDPLDGTTNFTNGIPHIAVSIGILEDGTRVAGFIFDPVRDEFFSALKGGGAFLNGKKIRVSEKKSLQDSVIVTGFPYDRYLKWARYQAAYEAIFQASRDLRRTGSATLDECWVACGRFDGFFEYSLRPWDVAAGSLIVEEAGGRVGNLDLQFQEKGFSIFGDSYIFSGPNVFMEMYTLGRNAEKGKNSI